jgi:hypothetical protein
MSDDDKLIVAAAKPFIRSIAALIIWLRFGNSTPAKIEACYEAADQFITHLDKDMAE